MMCIDCAHRLTADPPHGSLTPQRLPLPRLCLSPFHASKHCLAVGNSTSTHNPQVGKHSDPATARRGESLYAFVPRSVGGHVYDGVAAEAHRLRSKGIPLWSPRNRCDTTHASLCTCTLHPAGSPLRSRDSVIRRSLPSGFDTRASAAVTSDPMTHCKADCLRADEFYSRILIAVVH